MTARGKPTIDDTSGEGVGVWGNNRECRAKILTSEGGARLRNMARVVLCHDPCQRGAKSAHFFFAPLRISLDTRARAVQTRSMKNKAFDRCGYRMRFTCYACRGKFTGYPFLVELEQTDTYYCEPCVTDVGAPTSRETSSGPDDLDARLIAAGRPETMKRILSHQLNARRREERPRYRVADSWKRIRRNRAHDVLSPDR